MLQAIVDAQRDYASEDRDGDGVLAYARKFMSSPGKRDGLYWPTKAGEPPSPLGALVAQAAGEGYRATRAGPTPIHGYYYRMLKGQAQTADAPRVRLRRARPRDRRLRRGRVSREVRQFRAS